MTSISRDPGIAIPGRAGTVTVDEGHQLRLAGHVGDDGRLEQQSSGRTGDSRGEGREGINQSVVRVHPRRDHRVAEQLSPSIDDHADRVRRSDGLQHRGSELIGTSAVLRKVSGKTTVNPTPMTAWGERAMRPSQVPIQIMEDDNSSTAISEVTSNDQRQVTIEWRTRLKVPARQIGVSRSVGHRAR